MSKEEAIEILSEMRSEYNLFGDEEEATRYHVLSWAIRAMNAEPVVRCKDCENWVENEHCLAWAYEYSDANGYCYLGKRRGLIGTQMSLSERREDELLVTD
jgi:hypothetical protein